MPAAVQTQRAFHIIYCFSVMFRGGDFICFPHLRDIGVKVEPGQAATFRNLTVQNYRMPEHVLHHSMEDGLRLSGDEKGAFSNI